MKYADIKDFLSKTRIKVRISTSVCYDEWITTSCHAAISVEMWSQRKSTVCSYLYTSWYSDNCTNFLTSDSSENIKTHCARLKEMLVYKQTCQWSDCCISTARFFTMCVPFLCREWVTVASATEDSVQGPHKQVTQSQRAVQLTQSSFLLRGQMTSSISDTDPFQRNASLTTDLRSPSSTTMDWNMYSSWKSGSILISKN